VHTVEVSEIGGPDVRRYAEADIPSPGPGEVLIKADAIGVNFVDTYFRSGMYPHDVPFILGSEVCGTVEAVGDAGSTAKVGDRVASADAVDAYAEYWVAPASLVAHVPNAIASASDVATPQRGRIGLPDAPSADAFRSDIRRVLVASERTIRRRRRRSHHRRRRPTVSAQSRRAGTPRSRRPQDARLDSVDAMCVTAAISLRCRLSLSRCAQIGQSCRARQRSDLRRSAPRTRQTVVGEPVDADRRRRYRRGQGTAACG
jgi:Alcohol dehydrogenase GroES-like domain